MRIAAILKEVLGNTLAMPPAAGQPLPSPQAMLNKFVIKGKGPGEDTPDVLAEVSVKTILTDARTLARTNAHAHVYTYTRPPPQAMLNKFVIKGKGSGEDTPDVLAEVCMCKIQYSLTHAYVHTFTRPLPQAMLNKFVIKGKGPGEDTPDVLMELVMDLPHSLFHLPLHTLTQTEPMSLIRRYDNHT